MGDTAIGRIAGEGTVAEIRIERLDEASWAEAMRLCARAFVDYEYVHALFGDDPIDRLAGTTREFGRQRWDPRDLVMGAVVEATVVGLTAIEPLGACRVCEGPPPEAPVADDASERATYRFETTRREAHGLAPPHAHLKHVAVEPMLQAGGIGSKVVLAALEAYRESGSGPILLECIDALQPFYRRFGFRTTARFPDPVADRLVIMVLAA